MGTIKYINIWIKKIYFWEYQKDRRERERDSKRKKYSRMNGWTLLNLLKNRNLYIYGAGETQRSSNSFTHTSLEECWKSKKKILVSARGFWHQLPWGQCLEPREFNNFWHTHIQLNNWPQVIMEVELSLNFQHIFIKMLQRKKIHLLNAEDTR
jgi:hypothetical protein